MQRTHPLYSHIHLGADWDERRRVLAALKAPKLLQAVRYINERMGNLDLFKPHLSDERIEDSDGGYSCVRFEILQFHGVKSLEEVFDAVTFYHTNMEISVSEKLGHVAVRDDFTMEDNNLANFRMVSNDESGISTEMNIVTFGHLVENPDVPGEKMGVYIT